jgi:hypothetical protein
VSGHSQQPGSSTESLVRGVRRPRRPKTALVALVRELAVTLHAMLVHGRDFDETIQATAAA